MAWFTRFTILATALSLGLAVNVPTQVQAQMRSSSLSNRLQNAFRAPRTPQPAPVNTQSGASRGGCEEKEELPILLVPTFGGDTLAEYPTVFWYMPPTSAEAVEFVLRKENDVYSEPLYSVQYTLAKSGESVVTAPGIMSLTLPASASFSPLEVGQEYHLELTLICDQIDRSGDAFSVPRNLKRVAPDPTLINRLQQATPEQRIAMYADNQLWYETLTALIELRRTRPNDPNLTEAWNTLLNSVGLNTVAQKPLFQGASNITTNNQ